MNANIPRSIFKDYNFETQCRKAKKQGNLVAVLCTKPIAALSPGSFDNQIFIINLIDGTEIAKTDSTIEGLIQGTMFKYEAIEVVADGQINNYSAIALISRRRSITSFISPTNQLVIVLMHFQGGKNQGKDLKLVQGKIVFTHNSNWADRFNSELWFSIKEPSE